MELVFTSNEMKMCDEITINKFGVPGLLLMENAGRGVVEVVKKRYSPLADKKVLIVCGKGNNGGDGFVIARLLSNHVKKVDVLLMAQVGELKGDAKTNFVILQKWSKKLSKRIKLYRFSKKTLKKLNGYQIIIDAIFGTGFNGSVKKPYFEIIKWLNSQQASIVAVDIPSGVNGTTGEVENCAVCAEITITFGNLKSGLVCNKGRINSGALEVIDIGIPAEVTKKIKSPTLLIEQSDIQKILPKRSIFAHKYSVGKVFALAGSTGLTGAAAMCSTSALRAGAGAVMLGVPDVVYPILAKKLTEVMTYPLPSTKDGALSLDAFEPILEKLNWADVVIIGPGLSQSPETQKLIVKILFECKGKILIDADGLNAIASTGAGKLKSFKSEFILTPHVGEFSRLTNLSANEIERNRISIVREYSKKFNSVVLLKGVPTVTSAQNGVVVINSTGNSGMATAGAGDVLSGIIAALWAQGMNAFDAATTGAFIHGLSGDLVKNKIGERSLIANDLIEILPEAFKKIEVSVLK